MNLQKTIKNPATVDGKGLFSGEQCRLRFVPAPADSGIVFVCGADGATGETPIVAEISNTAKRARRSSLENGSASVETVEHVLSAVWGLGIDNLTIELSNPETPSLDGSSLPFVQVLQAAGIQVQDAEESPYVIDEPVAVSEGDAMLAALPGAPDHLDILYDLDYSAVKSIGRQVLGFRLGKDDYASQIAPSRTFLLSQEAREFQARGIGAHLTPKDLVVMDEEGVVENELRFADEHVRHKICDLIGDLALLGRQLRGRIVAYKSGHELNHQLVRRLGETI
ncbi:MAG: UDP-3-O-acyl-N-acetylglucosamine deacetylase, partial [Planctomycetota bacterium]